MGGGLEGEREGRPDGWTARNYRNLRKTKN